MRIRFTLLASSQLDADVKLRLLRSWLEKAAKHLQRRGWLDGVRIDFKPGVKR